MPRYLPASAAVASLAILFACSQQTSNAQEDMTPQEPDEIMEEGDVMPSEAQKDAEGPASIPSMMRATANVVGDDGNTVGNVNLIEGPNGILMEVSIDEGSLNPGWHAIHIHQVGTCEDTGEYTESGGHVGKIEGAHGLLNQQGPEKGDLPNLYVASDGSVNYQTFTNLISMSDILDDDGSAAIIHEGRDDQMSQPIGGAGSRVGCAVIE